MSRARVFQASILTDATGTAPIFHFDELENKQAVAWVNDIYPEGGDVRMMLEIAPVVELRIAHAGDIDEWVRFLEQVV